MGVWIWVILLIIAFAVWLFSSKSRKDKPPQIGSTTSDNVAFIVFIIGGLVLLIPVIVIILGVADALTGGSVQPVLDTLFD